MTTVFLDAGHTAGKDPGAVANDTTEHVEMAKLAYAVAAQLMQHALEVKVVPFSLTLLEKIAFVNAHAEEEDLLISLHMNAAKNVLATGSEVYFYGGSTRSRKRAAAFAKCLAEEQPLPLRGVYPDSRTRHGRLGIVRDTKPWAFLIETGFITNAGDLETVRNHGATALTRAIMRIL